LGEEYAFTVTSLFFVAADSYSRPFYELFCVVNVDIFIYYWTKWS